jgi:DNA-binding CsgD family transcriptional regulator
MMVSVSRVHTNSPAESEQSWHGTWPLIGRDQELAKIVDSMGRADRAILLDGPAGVGKTRLVSECTSRAEQRGLHPVRIVATRSASAIPLGPLASLLPTLTGRLDLDADLVAWAADALAKSVEGRLLLVVDDAHLLDDASATVVHELAQSGRAFIVATLRSGDPTPDPIHALSMEGLAVRLELRPLRRADVDELLDCVLGGPIDDACRRDLWDASGGNPLLLHELVVGAIDAGLLTLTDGVWRLARPLAATPLLTDVVDGRLLDLSEYEREVLELLAVGEPLELALLVRLSDLAVVERLERSHLVVVTRGGGSPEVRLAHPLYGDVLQARMSALRARAVNRWLADAAGDVDQLAPADVVRVAVWQLESGGQIDPELALAAARQAYFAHDDTLASRLARQALDGGGGIRAGLVLAQVLGQLGRHEERCSLDVELAGQASSDEERALVVMDHSVGLFWGTRQHDAAVEVLARAEQVASGPWRDEMTAQRASYEVMHGRLADGVALALPIFESNSSERARVTAALAVAPGLALMGRGDDAVSVTDWSFPARLALGDQDVLSDAGMHVVARVLAMAESGRLEEAHDTTVAAYETSVARHHKVGQAWFALMLGRVGLATGELAEASRRFDEGAGIFDAVRQDGSRRWCLIGAVLAAAMQGDASAAAAALATLDAVPFHPMLLMEPEVARARAWEAVAHGNARSARSRLLEAAGAAEEEGAVVLAMHAWHDLARLGFESEAIGPVERLAGSVEGPLAEIRAAHVRALVTGDVGGLSKAADAFEAIGAVLLAAEAVTAAAAAAHRRQEAPVAERLARRARALGARCQGARTPGLRLASAARALTRRERDVAALAAEGMATRAIAARLGMADRTVDNHLQRAFEKLGISDRNGLRDALGDGTW